MLVGVVVVALLGSGRCPRRRRVRGSDAVALAVEVVVTPAPDQLVAVARPLAMMPGAPR